MAAIHVDQRRQAEHRRQTESLESVRFGLTMLASARLLCPLTAVDDARYRWLGQQELALLGRS
jgi:hypothetical protein